jgi:hypothetical protein
VLVPRRDLPDKIVLIPPSHPAAFLSQGEDLHRARRHRQAVPQDGPISGGQDSGLPRERRALKTGAISVSPSFAENHPALSREQFAELPAETANSYFIVIYQ